MTSWGSNSFDQGKQKECFTIAEVEVAKQNKMEVAQPPDLTPDSKEYSDKEE